MESQHSPEDMDWVQEMDSLAFSVSPVGPSTSNNTRELEREDAGSMTSNNYDNSNSRSNDGDRDDEQSLVGENIWNVDSGNCGIDQEDVVDMDGDHRRHQSFENESINDDRSHVHPSTSPGTEGGFMKIYEDMEAVECKEQLAPHMIGSRGQDQDEAIENIQADGPPRRVDENGEYDEMSVSDDHGEEQSTAQLVEGDVELQEGKNGDENGWIDERVADILPAWDQGRPARMLSGDGADECCRRVSALVDESCPPRRARHPREASDFERSDSDLDASSSRDEGEMWPSRKAEPITRPVHRRTRLSLDRERRRLDRLPRSQRLRRVKGHPLGGMTLRELEDRHLLDVGIGEIARRLRVVKTRSGRVRQEDTDLLRRSARLLRRAQRERDARYALAIDQDRIRTPTRVHDSFGLGKQTASATGGRRRPASASRDPHRVASFSFSLDSVEQDIWANAYPGKPRPVDRRRHTNEGAPVNVGLYSGGGTRCSLKQRRPMSAKPAIPCRSGWESGRTKARCRDGKSSNFDEGRRAHLGETGYAGQGEELDETSISSDLVDLSPHGIVEYTDEEESPFNVDELERVAASYLLNPRGSVTCSSSSPQDDETQVDDGSVYIYREDAISPSQHEGWGEHGDYDDGEGSCTARRTSRCFVRQNDANHDVNQRWERGQHGEDPLPTRTKEDDANAKRRGSSPDNTRRDLFRRGLGESNDTVRPQDDYDGGKGDKYESSMSARNCIGPRNPGGDVAAGMCRKDNGGSSQQRPASCTCARGTVRGEGDLRQARGIPHRLPKGNDYRRKIDSNVRFDGPAASRADNRVQVDAPPEESGPVLAGTNYSPNVGWGVQGKKRGKLTPCQHGDFAVNSSAKVSQVAIRLREMILERQAAAGRSIRQIFGHFDRRGCGYVKADELRDALADLRLKLLPREALELHASITLDGGDRLSYAEFSVFVSDPYHAELQAEVCSQVAARLEVLGRHSVNLHAAFLPESLPPGTVPPREDCTEASRPNVEQEFLAKRVSGKRGEHSDRHFVTAQEFLAGLRAIGLVLSTSDSKRLIIRFDVHGDGYLSVDRFVSMVESSPAWTNAMTRLARQAEADEEADACLRAHSMTGRWPARQIINEEIVEMARYLGIRVSSDASLVWIAADALEAPLPDGWVIFRGKEGRYFYHNEFTDQSRWDHPLDSYFRRRYLRERFGSSYEDDELGLEPPESSEAATCFNMGVGASRPLMMLPPRQMRPNLRDYSATNALDNLRVRRLSARSGERSVAAGSAVATKVLKTRSTAPTYINSAWNGEESWDGRGDGPSSPAGGPKRRRPVSASALHQRSESSPTRSGGDSSHGFRVAEMAAELYARPLNAYYIGRRSTMTPRRPRSAKAALQRSAVDRQVPINRCDGQRDDQHKIKTPPRACNSQILKQSSPNRVDGQRMVRDAVDDDGGRETVNVSLHDTRIARHLHIHETHQGRERTGGFGRNNECEHFATNRHTLSQVDQEEMAEARVTREEERVWLLDRSTDTCHKLDDTEIPSNESDGQRRGGSGCISISSSNARGTKPQTRSHSLASEGRRGGPSSAVLGREENPLRKNTSRPSDGTSGLRDQGVKMDGRIRDLKTCLQDQSRLQGKVHRPRSLSFSGEREAVLATGAKSARVPEAMDTPRSGIWTKNSSSRDDLIVCSNAATRPNPSNCLYLRASGMEHENGDVPCADIVGGTNESLVTIANEAAISGTRLWEGVAKERNESKRIRSSSTPIGRGTGRGVSGGRGSGDGRFCSPGIVLI